MGRHEQAVSPLRYADYGIGEKLVRAPFLEFEIRTFPMLRPFSKREKAELKRRYYDTLAKRDQKSAPSQPSLKPPTPANPKSTFRNPQ
jgi:hypothetical protein